MDNLKDTQMSHHNETNINLRVNKSFYRDLAILQILIIIIVIIISLFT